MICQVLKTISLWRGPADKLSWRLAASCSRNVLEDMEWTRRCKRKIYSSATEIRWLVYNIHFMYLSYLSYSSYLSISTIMIEIRHIGWSASKMHCIKTILHFRRITRKWRMVLMQCIFEILCFCILKRGNYDCFNQQTTTTLQSLQDIKWWRTHFFKVVQWAFLPYVQFLL